MESRPCAVRCLGRSSGKARNSFAREMKHTFRHLTTVQTRLWWCDPLAPPCLDPIDGQERLQRESLCEISYRSI